MWKNLGHHMKTCQSFATWFQFSLLPLQTTHVCLFAAHLAGEGKSHAPSLNKEWLTFLHLGMNPGMWKNLGHHMKTCQSFATWFQFSLLPLQTTHVCLFAAHLAGEGKSHATKNYLNSLSTDGQLWGYPSLYLQNVFIHLTLRGIL